MQGNSVVTGGRGSSELHEKRFEIGMRVHAAAKVVCADRVYSPEVVGSWVAGNRKTEKLCSDWPSSSRRAGRAESNFEKTPHTHTNTDTHITHTHKHQHARQHRLDSHTSHNAHTFES